MDEKQKIKESKNNCSINEELEKLRLELKKELEKRKKIEEKLLKLSHAVEQSPSAVLVTNLKAEIEYINPKFTKITGYTEKEIIGKNPRILKSHYTSSEKYKEIWKIITAGKEWQGEFLNKKKNGELYWESASISPIKDKNGKIIRYIKIAEDITERKSSETTLLELKKAVETMQLGVTIIDIKGKIIYTNSAEAKMHGYFVEELIGKDVGILSLPKLRKKMTIDQIQRLKGISRESVNIRKDGSSFPVRLISDVVRNNDGKPIAVVTTCEDITEWKGKEKALSELKKAVETMRLGVTITDIDGKIIYTNSADAFMHGYSTEELIGKDIGIFATTKQRKPMTFHQIVKLKGLVRESINVRKDGSIFPVRLMSDVVKNTKNEPIAIVTTCEDITERKKAEEEVIRLAAIVESSDDAIIGITLEGYIISWNLGAKNIFGYSAEEIKGNPYTMLIPSENNAEIKKLLEKIKKGKHVENYETKFIKKDRKEIYVSLTISPIKDSTEKIIGISTISRDITERKLMEDALQHSEDQLRTIFAGVNDGIAVLDKSAKVIKVNEALLKMGGYDEDEIVGKRLKAFTTIFPPKSMTKILLAFGSLIMGKQVQAYEVKANTKSGDKIDIEINSSVMRKGRKIIGIVAVLRNITERKKVSERLRLAKEHAELLNRVVPSAIFTVDTEKKITSWNDKAAEITGYSANEVLGKECILFAKAPCDVGCRLYDKGIEKPINCKECTINTKEGKSRVILKNADILKDNTGNIIGGIESFEDITGRIKAETALKKSEEKFRTLTENVRVGVYRNTPGVKGKFIEVNPAIIEMFGYNDKEEFMKESVSNLYQKPSLRERFSQEMLEKGYIRDEEILRRKDGSTFIGLVTASAVKNEFGKVQYFDGIIEDITKQKEAEIALRESEEKYRSIFELSPEAIVLTDNKGKILDTNGRIFDWLGYKPEDVIGKNILFLHFITHKSREIMVQKFHERMAGKEVFSYELDFIAKNGDKHIGNILAAPLRDDNGKIIGDIIVIPDITERKKAEEHKAKLYEEIESINQELKDFAYVVSHDLKAPLRAINSLANWISEDYSEVIDKAGREQLKLMIQRVNRMRDLINGILQYSRVGRIREEKVEVILSDLVPEIVDLISPPANIKIKIDNELPTIIFEKTRITQVFQNLLSNAVKYMDKTQGLINIGCSDEIKYWKFYVKDNGPGIEEKFYDTIFRIFQTLQPKDKYESTGIGLTMIKKIIEMNKGKIWVKSELGKGSTFFFTLPKED